MKYDIEKIALHNLSDAYISIHFIDLVEGVSYPVKTNVFLTKCMDNTDILQEKMNNVWDLIPIPEHRQMMKDFTDFSTLEERMKNVVTITNDFQGMIHGWCRARFVKVINGVDEKDRYVLFLVGCIDEEKKRADNLLYMSEHDLMTGVYNRVTGERMIGELLKKGAKGVFCLFDIDEFKAINDKYGHAIGDKAIIAVAKALKSVRKFNKDVALRLGGDEFAVYFSDIKSKEEAEFIIQTLFDLISKIEVLPDNAKINVSLGAVLYENGLDFDEIYRRADACVYKAKNLSGNSYLIDDKNPNY